MTTPQISSGLPTRLEEWVTERGADLDSFWAYQNVNYASLVAIERMSELVAREAGPTFAGWRLLWLLAVVGQSEPRRIAATIRPQSPGRRQRLEHPPAPRLDNAVTIAPG